MASLEGPTADVNPDRRADRADQLHGTGAGTDSDSDGAQRARQYRPDLGGARGDVPAPEVNATLGPHTRDTCPSNRARFWFAATASLHVTGSAGLAPALLEPVMHPPASA